MTPEAAIRELLSRPELSGSGGARSRLSGGEIGDAASYLILDIAEADVRISPEQKAALLVGLEEYARGDKDLYDAYARLLG